ncbi:PP0621 family protein [Rhodoferax saidenbachensis]|uniref:Deaminase n=1 Tax=Rhodoferax saidenbachensis TaxID=1484693 RepID=A0ABU1ZK34_9BURK|nr:PP0621 family protein [Rhodoferax saidenbachensis]MDR7305915.1 uncharacterized protein [Rhodoferax saidenbachensis]
MKYLLVFLVVFLVAWRWRSARGLEHHARAQDKATRLAEPTTMVACRRCGVHLPEHDAVPGTHGSYCSAAHRAAAES